MRRSIAVVLAGLLFCSLANSQEKPEAPQPKTDRKVFLARVSLLAASKTADAITTRQLLDRGGWENDFIFGRHPSPAKQSLINLGIFGVQAGLFYLTEHNRTGRALPAVFGVLFRYVFADGTELHIYLHELFRPEIHKLLELAITIHGPARIEMPRPGRLQ